MSDARRCPRCGAIYGKNDPLVQLCDLCHVALLPVDITTPPLFCRADGLVYMDAGNGASNVLFRIVEVHGEKALQFHDKRTGGEVLVTLEQLRAFVNSVT